MRRIAYLALVPLMLLTLAAPMVSLPPTGPKGNSDNSSALLVYKTAEGPDGISGTGDDWAAQWDVNLYGTGKTFGEIKYKSDEFDIVKLQLHGMKANNWYLVTFWTADWASDKDPATASLLASSPGAFGGKYQWGVYFTDVALVKTDGEGNVNVIMPINEATWDQTYRASDYVASPYMATGDYTGVRVTVKDVGYSTGGVLDGFPAMTAGGPAPYGTAPSLLNPVDVLYEYATLTFTAA